MSLVLHDLLTCCRRLENERATERRNEIENFKRLLRDPETVLQLDRNSDSRRGNQLNWDAVFSLLKKSFQKEMENLRLTKPNASASTQTSKRKRMQEIGSLVKYFIRRANRRGPRLECQELLNYVLHIIKDPASCAAYGSDCSSILLKDILSVRKYWCEISQQQWPDLLILYGKFYLTPSGKMNRVLVARIIHTLMRGYCFQTDQLRSDVFSFFSTAMQYVRQERNTAGLDHIIAAMNIFFNTFAVNCRKRICKTGEEILPTVLYIWTQYRPKDSLKESIIELFLLQVHIHHPRGATSQEKGAHNSEKWQSILHNLFDLLVNEINVIGSRGKYSSGSRSVAIKENLIELMADICHQVFTEDTKVLEITQSYTVTQSGGDTVPSKRRRIELGWEVIRENLQRSQKDFHVVPWLQITARLLSKYPMSFPNCELPQLLNILHQLLPHQRRGERTPYVLKCLTEIALCQNQKTDLKSTHKLELQRTWSKIWSLTIRSISFQQIETEIFGLLGAMIQGNLVVTDKELWKIFSGPACKPSSSAVCCLALAMSAYSVPENLDVGMEQTNRERNLDSVLKEAIMKWALSCNLEEEMEECSELPPVLCSDFPHLTLQKVLVSLTMKNSRATMTFFQNDAKCVQHLQGKEENSFLDVEELYLQTTFDEMDIFTNFAVNVVDKNVTGSRFVINQSLRETLECCLLAMSEKLLSSYAPKSKLVAAEHLVRCVSLLIGVLGCYCYTGVFTEEDACKSELFQKAKSLIHYIGESISNSSKKLNEDAQISSLRTLIMQCTKCLCNCTKNSANKMVSDLFLRLLTSKFINDLLDVCKNLMTFTGKPSELGEVDLVGNDPEESIMEADNQVSDDLFDDHSVTDISDTNESGEMQNVTGAVSPLAEEQLTKQDLLHLEILRFLCICATTVQIQTMSFRASDIRRKLLMLTDGSIFDSAKPLHLHVYLLLLKELPVEENLLTVDEVLKLLTPLSDVCSLYRRDQDVCKVILNNLLPIAVSLAQSGTRTEEKRNAQEQFLTVVGAFWTLAQGKRCTAPVRVALLNCMKALLEADPYSKWAILNVKNEDLPVSEVFPHFLADSHHQVSILAAKSITSLFQDVKQRDSSGLSTPLPLKLQQKAFENVYLRVQEGMGNSFSGDASPEDVLDKQCNRKAVLLMLITMVLCCSPVCEKQALFAICQSVKENGLEPHLVKKVLKKVSDIFGYKNIEDFMTSHLDYLVVEWLKIKDSGYSLSAFPYVLLNYTGLEEFYRSCYKVLVPHLVIRSQFDDVKSLANKIGKDWRQVLADCFPKILVNILPHFASQSHGQREVAEQRETASKVYDVLKDDNCLGKQQIDNLSHNNLSEIVVELLMTLHEPPNVNAEKGPHLSKYIRELDPAPNPPHFPSYVIKATLDHISNCHKSELKSLVAVLSKSPDSFQKILLALCKHASDMNNIYKKHRVLIIYHFFVSLLLKEIKDGLGGAWAFVLRDVIYTLIHHISSRPLIFRDVSMRSFLLCCDLLCCVCHTAVKYCSDALESHLHVIVGTLIPLAVDQPEIQPQVLRLLKYLVIDSKDNVHLYQAIKRLDPFPEYPAFEELRTTQLKIKYSKGPYSLLEEINRFLSVSVCDSLPLTRLEGLYDLRKQLEQYKDQMKDLLKTFQENPEDSVMVKLVVSLLQLSKMAVNHAGEKAVLEAVGSCLGEIGPMDFSTIALQHAENALDSKAADLLEDKKLQWVFIMLTQINTALTDNCIDVRAAAVSCLKNILATNSGSEFWEVYKSQGDPMLIYLQPFRMPKKKVLAMPANDSEASSETLDDTNLWIPLGESHETWIKNLTRSILDSGGVQNEVLKLMKPLCEVKTDLSQTLLPYLIHDILLHDSNESWRNILSVHVRKFFTACCRFASSSRSATPQNSDSEQETHVLRSVDKVSRRTMLAVVDYLRRQKRSVSGTVFDDSFWLDLNYLEVAVAAQSCAAHFTALLYAEIYADKINMDKQQKRSSFKAAKSLTFEEESEKSTIAILNEKSKETGISLQDLLMDIYKSIGEPDSLYGCGGGRMLQPLARIRTYEHEAVWDKALLTYDLEATLSPSTRQAGIIEALQNFGLCHTLSMYLKGLEHENTEWCAELQEIRYQAAWRNMQWDNISSVKDETGGSGYHESLYDALQSLRDKEFSTFYDTLKVARVNEVEELCKGSLESVYTLYPSLCRLQLIGELENIGLLFSSNDCRPATTQQLNDIYLKWQRQSQLLEDSDFHFQEPIMALRTVVLEILLEKENESAKRECIKDILTKHLVELSKLARTANNTQLPERAMFQIKQHNPTQYGVSEWQLEEAQVFWAKKEESLALNILKELIKKLDAIWFQVENDPHLKLMYTECLRLCGTWLAETCLENPTVIMQKYLEKAVEIAASHHGDNSDELKKGKTKAFLSLARFSDNQYQRIENYMKSSEFENKQALLKKAKEEVGLLRERKVQTNRYTVKVQRELELDECAIHALTEDRQRFLCKAVENYISCLLSGEEHDMWIFRLCSLWLENSGVDRVNEMMKKNAEKIPSYKFLPLMYQLAARMGTKMMGGLGFHEVLNNLMSRISLDHPHHTLFIILALANANKDELLTKTDAKRINKLIKNAPKEISQLDVDRMEAARKIINIIRKRRAHMVRDVEALCDAYITLANVDATPWKTQRGGISIPADQPIIKLKNLKDVVVPTMEIKVDPTGRYENLVTVMSFKPEFHLAGGLNLPKIIDCVGSDGKERRQLVKGRDDLRQDAVMQQVFQMCNTLLQQNTETRKRKLTIRRYKVVPLSQRSGVLEWCSGTIPIGEFLVNADQGAHKRYRPHDYSGFQCQKIMMDAQKKHSEEKYNIFMKVCDNFQPVFRYFCMEKFRDPAVWFEKRLAYTRSVATSSIVGYILGLGDRHVQNILIDEQTAELVHIDLGVAFEQGKILPTPETVPFRLTRDIVDGMGITGVEGVFRRCCEKTMAVMRNSQEALLTIVEVLLYDPLFDWTMNPLKALYLQQGPEDEADMSSTLGADPQACKRKASDDQSFNKVAERVLMRLQEKLKGVEEGTVLSVGGQVNLLIQQAMDPKNLSRLFPGWKPWV